MRRFARVIAAATLIAFGCSLAVAENVRPPFDPIKIPPVGEVARFKTVESIPRQIQRGISALDCRLNEIVLRDVSVLLFRPVANARPLVLVTCAGVMRHSYVMLFDKLAGEPVVLSLPVLRVPHGLSASKSPGSMAWDPTTNLLSAISGNDACGGKSYAVRHIYRYGAPHDPRYEIGARVDSFTLERVDIAENNCRTLEWRPFWKPPELTLP